MVVIGKGRSLLQFGPAMNHKAVLAFFHSAGRQLVEFLGNGHQAVGFFDPQLACSGNHGIALGTKGRHGDNGDFVNQARHDFSTESHALEGAVFHQHIRCGFPAACAFILQGNLGTHVLEHIENACAGGIDAHVL